MCGLDYTLIGNAYPLDENDHQLLVDHPPNNKKDWAKYEYSNYKEKLKAHHYRHQIDRCAYCRKKIEGAAKYEPLEHIVAKSRKPEWMLEPKNLIVSCDSCNNLKGDKSTLHDDYADNDEFPEESDAFLIFNPHFDTWSEHLQYENDLFIVPIAESKGYNTIRICKLYRFNVILNRSKELRLGQQSPQMQVIDRLSKLDKNDELYDDMFANFQQAMKHFNERMKDNKRFD